jgi:hypothetical protein
MGGGAIKNPATGASITGRLPLAPYAAVKRFVLEQLARRGVAAETVLELPGKQSFGDLDILYVKGPATPDMCSVAKDVCRLQEPWHVTTNGRVMSCAFDWKGPVLGNEMRADVEAEALTVEAMKSMLASAEAQVTLPQYFQVDFIATPTPLALDAARFYFSYGDVGAIIGRLTNHYSLKFGDIGLFCDVLEHTVNPSCLFDVRHTVGKLVLSSDPRAICSFLGLDFAFWERAIPTLPAGEWVPIFKWVEASPLFERRIFASLNSDHRARFSMRPFYRQFVEYLGISELTLADASNSESGGAEVNMQPQAVKHFGKEAELQSLYATVLADRARNAKFRGSDLLVAYSKILQRPAPTGKQAGAAIARFQRFCVSRSSEVAAAETSSSSSDDSGGGRELGGRGTRSDALAQEWKAFLDRSTRDEVLLRLHDFVGQIAEEERTA